MLNLLVKYAQDHELDSEPGFSRKMVRWAIAFDEGGQFLDVLPLGDTSLKKNSGRSFARCPDYLPGELKHFKKKGSHFLVATCDVLAMYVADNTKEEELQVTEGKHAHFNELLRSASHAVPYLDAIAETLEDSETLAAIQQRLKALKAKPTDSATLMVGSEFPVELMGWRPWWRAFRQDISSARKPAAATTGEPNYMVCLATGEVVVPARLHPLIKGLGENVGARPGGCSLVSYEGQAFRSYGLEQSANGAVSPHASFAYKAALDELLSKHSGLMAGAEVVHWFSTDIDSESDPCCWLQESNEKKELTAQERAKQLLRSMRTGKRTDLHGTRYYALVISGAVSRVMIRDWLEGSFEDLVASIGAWFEDLSIVNYSGSAVAREPNIERVITCLLPPKLPGQDYKDWVKPVGGARSQLWRAALLRDISIPYSVLAGVLVAHRTFAQTGQLEEALKNRNDLPRVASLLHVRMGLMKAYHCRKAVEGGYKMGPYLNEDHPDPAYQCGRLMAVLAQLQRAANENKDVGAGVVQRFYAAASTTPALVLGRLTRTSQFHLNKLDGGLAHWFDEKLSQIWSRIQNRPPTVLSLEEQSLFALGYYQQMAADWPKKLATPGTTNADGETHLEGGGK